MDAFQTLNPTGTCRQFIILLANYVKIRLFKKQDTCTGIMPYYLSKKIIEKHPRIWDLPVVAMLPSQVINEWTTLKSIH